MGRALGAGLLGGLVGGVLAGTLLSVMHQTPPAGDYVTPMRFAARALGSTGLLGGWAVVLIAGVALGAVFGLIAGALRFQSGAVASLGFFLAVLVWAVSAFLVVPLLLGVRFADAVRTPQLAPWLVGMVVPSVAYAAMLTAVVLAVGAPRRRETVAERREPARRAA